MESKNNHAVRRYGFHYRYDTQNERKILARLWQLVCLKLNYFTATKKPVGWSQDAAGRRKRVYDTPQTSCEHLISSGVISTKQIEELQAMRASINPANFTRDILQCQDLLVGVAKRKTQELAAQVETRNIKRTTRLSGGIKTKTA